MPRSEASFLQQTPGRCWRQPSLPFLHQCRKWQKATLVVCFLALACDSFGRRCLKISLNQLWFPFLKIQSDHAYSSHTLCAALREMDFFPVAGRNEKLHTEVSTQLLLIWWTVLWNIQNIPPNIALKTPPAVMLAACVHAKSLESSPILCDPTDPPGSSVHGILQARILEWVAMPSSRGSSWPRDRTRVFHVSCTSRRVFTTSAWEAQCGAGGPYVKRRHSAETQAVTLYSPFSGKSNWTPSRFCGLFSPTKQEHLGLFFLCLETLFPGGGSLSLPHHQWLKHHLIQATLLRTETGGLPGGPVVQTARLQRRGRSLDLRSGN